VVTAGFTGGVLAAGVVLGVTEIDAVCFAAVVAVASLEALPAGTGPEIGAWGAGLPIDADDAPGLLVDVTADGLVCFGTALVVLGVGSAADLADSVAGLTLVVFTAGLVAIGSTAGFPAWAGAGVVGLTSAILICYIIITHEKNSKMSA
jgi:hypothetical protein